jgi:hypothetical protein
MPVIATLKIRDQLCAQRGKFIHHFKAYVQGTGDKKYEEERNPRTGRSVLPRSVSQPVTQLLSHSVNRTETMAAKI